ncbi:hypothetical protein BU24DRAFT_456511 [Aaosphaeria arxii CBS 175.79]|uniref:WSC domain-containing protein n=1 Tax=Aaosphaeria arxii CBS 175.79 TaxID=1450172 RepID=A0A6A5Y5D7_9PLEO|nr:uncharacterized protein BU24DRAFT_456511 [Aaosphaeria arxii CBS 175.79]KAF2020433.1 hypothetical protein BU24DRAFT_456511 [Aaosphaeria arxii CBS 175.79]
MLRFLLTSLLFCPLALVASFDEDDWLAIRAPTEVTAGVPFNVTFDVEVHNWATTFCHAFRVYLASSAREKISASFFDSDCYLLQEETLCNPTIEIDEGYVLFRNTTVTVTVPPSVGPSGKHYTVQGRILKTDGSYYGSSLDSNVFNLSGGTGEWADYELKGYTLWGDDGIPCGGYDCVRGCNNATFSAFDRNSTRECANSCPGVFINPTSSFGGQPTATMSMPSACSIEYSSSIPATSTTRTLPSTTIVRSSTNTPNTATSGSVPKFPFISLIPLLAVFLS